MILSKQLIISIFVIGLIASLACYSIGYYKGKIDGIISMMNSFQKNMVEYSQFKEKHNQ